MASKQPPDLLYGLDAIGEAIGMGARQVQFLHGKGDLPTFKMGRTVCALRSALQAHFEQLTKEAR